MQKNVQAIADQSLALTLLPFEHWAQWADFFVQQPATWMTSLAKSTEQAQAEPTAQTRPAFCLLSPNRTRWSLT